MGRHSRPSPDDSPADSATRSPSGFLVRLPLAELMALSPLGVVIHDRDGRVVDANAAFAHLLGYTLHEVVGMRADQVVHPEELPERNALAAQLASGDKSSAVAERRLLRQDGSTVQVRVHKSAIDVGLGSDTERLIMVCVQDVGEDRRRIDQLAYAATHDELTGLHNRSGLRQALERWQKVRGGGILAVLDVNRLKAVNDEFGHAAGDELLRTIADRLGTGLGRETLVGRIGGDEFVVITGMADAALSESLAAAIDFDLPVRPGRSIAISASVGTANFTAHSVFDDVLNEADQQMYARKREPAADAV